MQPADVRPPLVPAFACFLRILHGHSVHELPLSFTGARGAPDTPAAVRQLRAWSRKGARARGRGVRGLAPAVSCQRRRDSAPDLPTRADATADGFYFAPAWRCPTGPSGGLAVRRRPQIQMWGVCPQSVDPPHSAGTPPPPPPLGWRGVRSRRSRPRPARHGGGTHRAGGSVVAVTRQCRLRTKTEPSTGGRAPDAKKCNGGVRASSTTVDRAGGCVGALAAGTARASVLGHSGGSYAPIWTACGSGQSWWAWPPRAFRPGPLQSPVDCGQELPFPVDCGHELSSPFTRPYSRDMASRTATAPHRNLPLVGEAVAFRWQMPTTETVTGGG